MIECAWEYLSLCPQNDSAYYCCIVRAMVALWYHWMLFISISSNISLGDHFYFYADVTREQRHYFLFNSSQNSARNIKAVIVFSPIL